MTTSDIVAKLWNLCIQATGSRTASGTTEVVPAWRRLLRRG